MNNMNTRKHSNKKSIPALLTVTLLIILLTGCGQSGDSLPNSAAPPPSPTSEPKDTAEPENKFEIILNNPRLRECVYKQLGKENDAPLYEEELDAYRGLLLDLDHYSITITNGQEADFVRTYFDLDSFYYFNIEFTPDLHDWSLSQLEGLNDFQKSVWISGTEDTIPAEVLVYFTGTDELMFDNIADVTGTLPPGKSFPATVRKVTIATYQSNTPYTFENLFACMQDSGVEYVNLRLNSDFPFLLDAAASMKSLVSLTLINGNRIRVENKECLSKSPLQTLTNFVLDGETDTSIFQILPQLGRIECNVAADADLSFLSENETLSLRLFFCPQMIEFSSDSKLYPDCTPAVFPTLDDALGWRGAGDENNFLAIYQRFADEGRNIECFSIRCLSHEEDYYPMRNVRTFFRVTDGEHVQQFGLEPLDYELFVPYGSYRTDPANLIDINFDGINDITLDSGSFGNSEWHLTYAWIYDPASGLYLSSPSFGSIVNPSVDSEQHLVRSRWRNNAVSHGWAIYRYDEDTGNFRIERQLIEDDVTLRASELMPDIEIPKNGRLWEWEETVYGKDGETVDKYYAIVAPGLQTEYPDAYYRFHEPDSYWGH